MPDPEETPPVRQRNTTAYPWTFAETQGRPAYTVLPGEETEHPVLLDGWTAVDGGAAPAPAADEAVPKTARKRAAAADTDTKDGGEPR